MSRTLAALIAIDASRGHLLQLAHELELGRALTRAFAIRITCLPRGLDSETASIDSSALPTHPFPVSQPKFIFKSVGPTSFLLKLGVNLSSQRRTCQNAPFPSKTSSQVP